MGRACRHGAPVTVVVIAVRVSASFAIVVPTFVTTAFAAVFIIVVIVVLSALVRVIVESDDGLQDLIQVVSSSRLILVRRAFGHERKFTDVLAYAGCPTTETSYKRHLKQGANNLPPDLIPLVRRRGKAKRH